MDVAHYVLRSPKIFCSGYRSFRRGCRIFHDHRLHTLRARKPGRSKPPWSLNWVFGIGLAELIPPAKLQWCETKEELHELLKWIFCTRNKILTVRQTMKRRNQRTYQNPSSSKETTLGVHVHKSLDSLFAARRHFAPWCHRSVSRVSG